MRPSTETVRAFFQVVCFGIQMGQVIQNDEARLRDHLGEMVLPQCHGDHRLTRLAGVQPRSAIPST